MTYLHSGLFILHVLVGSMALLLFWIPTMNRKGSLDHRRFGRYYSVAMYTVAFSGAMMALLVLWDPIAIKGHLRRADTSIEQFSQAIRAFWYFLLYLSLITFVSVRQGNAVLRHKTNRIALRQWHYQAPLLVLPCAALMSLYLGITRQHTLLIIFAGLGLFIAFGMLRYCWAKQVHAKAWLVEHLGAMIGSGIGAHTAFLAFGGRQLISEFGQWQTLFWVAPGIIGGIAIARLSRRYTPAPKQHQEAV
ncbi:hypothetical protein LJ739_17445 [Aestuariibacter halophilus]|uniref:DUF2306 domain-containing protein n=1 Tax=Fluctibacter halophilus TaxID=226011 RepID=A0ABS8GC26_9ALTE|nr:hypothetical protein [Aestuariibacter halophilus]MCC2618043.1 hypothetical protein [Aestuariibacter halophilus]